MATNGTASDGLTNAYGIDAEPPQPRPTLRNYSAATLAIHADDHLNPLPDVAPPLHVATTFRYDSNPDLLVPAKEIEVRSRRSHPAPPLTPQEDASSPTDRHIYSRHTAPNTTRLEALLTSLLHAPSLTYSSGLAALHAFYVHLAPRRVAITAGYHGAHGVLALHARLTGLRSTAPQRSCSPTT